MFQEQAIANNNNAYMPRWRKFGGYREEEGAGRCLLQWFMCTPLAWLETHYPILSLGLAEPRKNASDRETPASSSFLLLESHPPLPVIHLYS